MTDRKQKWETKEREIEICECWDYTTQQHRKLGAIQMAAQETIDITISIVLFSHCTPFFQLACFSRKYFCLPAAGGSWRPRWWRGWGGWLVPRGRASGQETWSLKHMAVMVEYYMIKIIIIITYSYWSLTNRWAGVMSLSGQFKIGKIFSGHFPAGF